MKLEIAQAVFVLQPNLTSLFAPFLSPRARIILPTTPNYTAQIPQRWTDYNAPSYSLGSIRPATFEDVQQIVKISSANCLPILATGGGHGVSDYHSFHGLCIDLSAFSDISLTEDNSRLTIGGAVKFKQLIQPLYDAKKELPLGSCACVGVVGATLGGGIGALQGRRGLMLDSLESVEIVTPDSELCKASKNMNANLFWAVRGAGSNFGVVVSATYLLPPITNDGQYVNADFVFPAAMNASLWGVLQALGSNMPPELAINSVVFYNRVISAPMIAVNMVFHGPQQEGEQWIEHFVSLDPLMSNISMVPANQIMEAAFFNSFGQDNGACTPNQHINIYTLALKKLDVSTFQAFFQRLVDFWEAWPDFQGRWLMQQYSPKGPLSTPAKATAYGYRDATMYMNLEGFYSDTDLDEVVNAFWASARQDFAKASGYGHLAVYQNYARGDEGPRAWYGTENLERLVVLKNKYDPDEQFSVNNPIPLRLWQ